MTTRRLSFAQRSFGRRQPFQIEVEFGSLILLGFYVGNTRFDYAIHQQRYPVNSKLQPL